MITEDYCSFEISKLLKEKGFHAPDLHGLDSSLGHLWIKVTHQMAMKWLREKHKLFIDICFQKDENGSVTWFYMTWALDNRKRDVEEMDFASYEEAVETALKYVLENLI